MKWSIIVHWTGGSYVPSAYEKTRYHSFTTGDGEFVEGGKPPEANRAPLGPDYVRHTGGGNSNRIGHALCGMGGDDVRERPLNMGSFPIKRDQLRAAAPDLADYCQIYDIPVSRIETHAEYYQRTKRGAYKWDITCLEGHTEVAPAEEIGDMLRGLVRIELDSRQAPAPLGAWATLLTPISEWMKK